MTDYPNPREYGLPHNEWRPNQYETYQWAKEQRGVALIELPTGGGKTGIATALTHDYTVTSLVKTKNLQTVNYGGIYEWNLLRGRRNYACAQFPGLAADECPEAESGMNKCEGAERCPYLQAKRKVQGSRKASLNYSYWLAARWVRQEQYLPQVLVCDEADELPDLVADWAGCTITERDRQNWGLPIFPYLSGVDDPTSPTDSVSVAVDWLERSREILGRAWRVYEHPSNPKEKSLRDRVEELGQKVRNTLDCLQMNSSDWFIRSGPTARQFNGDSQPAFICRPLTARYHWGRYFDVAQTTVLMSATIGQPEPLARELGIEEFAFRSVPSQWPPEMRPILCPSDAPALGRKAEPSAYEKQADIAAKLLGECDPNWFGIVLVTSKAEAQAVAQRLAKRGYEDRVWVIPEKEHGQWVGTDRQTELWTQRKRSKPGSIMVSWSHWRGYDGLDEKILLVCKCLTPDMKLFGPLGMIDIEQAEIGDEVFSVDENGNMILDKIEDIVTQEWDGEILSLKGQQFDLTVTDNHELLVQEDYRSSDWNFVKRDAKETRNLQRFLIPITSRNWRGLKPPEFISFEKFFDKDTIIWGDTKESMPFFSEMDYNQHLYKIKWSDRGTWQPNPSAKYFFSDGNHCNKIPFYIKTELVVRLIGWFASEGHLYESSVYEYLNTRAGKTYRVGLTQNLGENLDEMVDLLKNLEIPYSVQVKTENGRRIQFHSKVIYHALETWCGKGANNKRLPDWVTNSDSLTLKTLLDTLLKGDGSLRTRGAVYYTNSQELRDDVVEVGLKLGMRANFHLRRSQWEITLSSSKNRGTVKTKDMHWSNYKGIVWCVRTKSGNILVSRNGKFAFVGNCPYPRMGQEGSFENQYMRYDGKRYHWRTANLLMQGCGRTRRGREEDYGVGNGLVAVLDANWVKVKKNLSSDWLSAVVQ